MISSQILDVAIRVKVIRAIAVKNSVSLLKDQMLVSDSPGKDTLFEVLYAAAWIVGEFAEYLEDFIEVTEALLQPRVSSLPGHIQSVYMHNLLKLVAFKSGNLSEEGVTPTGDDKELDTMLELIKTRLPVFTQSVNLETQERACFALELVQLIIEARQAGTEISTDLLSLFKEPLNPVAENAQGRVRVPDDLDLDTQLYDPPDEEDDQDTDWNDTGIWDTGAVEEKISVTTAEDIQRQKDARRERYQNDPNILKDDLPPIEKLTAKDLNLTTSTPPTYKPTPQVKSGKKKKPINVSIDTTEEIPEDALPETKDKKK